jgi:hypothetical protein
MSKVGDYTRSQRSAQKESIASVMALKKLVDISQRISIYCSGTTMCWS